MKKSESMSNEDWEELELKTASTIRLCLADEVIYNVINEESTPKLWMELESLYIKKSLMNKLFMKKQLYILRMVEGTNMLEHLNLFNKLISQLLNVDIKVKEEDKTLIILVSLPRSYEHLVTTFLYGRDILEMEDVMTAHLSNEVRNKSSMLELQVEGLVI